MAFALAHSSDLIRAPLTRHLRELERHERFVAAHIEFCRRTDWPCLILFALNDGRLECGYVKLRQCSTTSLMTFGLEEHEAIEVRKAVEREETAVLIADGNFQSGKCSFVLIDSP